MDLGVTRLKSEMEAWNIYMQQANLAPMTANDAQFFVVVDRASSLPNLFNSVTPKVLLEYIRIPA